jgi:hypothetical protein
LQPHEEALQLIALKVDSSSALAQIMIRVLLHGSFKCGWLGALRLPDLVRPLIRQNMIDTGLNTLQGPPGHVHGARFGGADVGRHVGIDVSRVDAKNFCPLGP